MFCVTTCRIRTGIGGSELHLRPSGSGVTFIGNASTNLPEKLLYVFLIVYHLEDIFLGGKV